MRGPRITPRIIPRPSSPATSGSCTRAISPGETDGRRGWNREPGLRREDDLGEIPPRRSKLGAKEGVEPKPADRPFPTLKISAPGRGGCRRFRRSGAVFRSVNPIRTRFRSQGTRAGRSRPDRVGEGRRGYQVAAKGEGGRRLGAGLTGSVRYGQETTQPAHLRGKWAGWRPMGAGCSGGESDWEASPRPAGGSRHAGWV